MKILISTDEYEYQINGVTNSVVALRDELRKLGHEVRVLALSPNKESFKKGEDYYISSFHMPIYPDARYTFKYHDKLLDEIIEWNPDIVHIQTEFATRKLAMRVLKRINKPYVMTCHAVYEDYISYFSPSKKIGKLIIKRLSNKYYNKSDGLVVPSSKLKDIELGYNIKCPIHVIPTGIDLKKYNKELSIKDRNKIYKELNLSSEDAILVTVCRIAVEKNIDEILDYLPVLAKQNEHIRFLIVGDGPYKKKLEKKVLDMDLIKYVRFTGMIDPKEVYKYYNLGDIFVCASTSESQGLTYVEALTSSLPMVCKKDRCLDDIIDEGKNGYQFTDKDSFITSINKILSSDNLKLKMKEYSKEKSLSFSKEKFGKDMEELYKSLLENK